MLLFFFFFQSRAGKLNMIVRIKKLHPMVYLFFGVFFFAGTKIKLLKQIKPSHPVFHFCSVILYIAFNEKIWYLILRFYSSSILFFYNKQSLPRWQFALIMLIALFLFLWSVRKKVSLFKHVSFQF